MPGPDREPPAGVAAAFEEITNRTTAIVREEIELAKAEIMASVMKLVRGAVIGIAAGVFFLLGAMYVLYALGWVFAFEVWDSTWAGFLTLAALLFILGGVAGFLAAKLFKAGQTPVPTMAIDEAKKVRETVQTAAGKDGPS